MESTSSIKIMVGAASRAITNSSRTMRAPSPMYFCTSSAPDTRIKVQSYSRGDGGVCRGEGGVGGGCEWWSLNNGGGRKSEGSEFEVEGGEGGRMGAACAHSVVRYGACQERLSRARGAIH
jgi:hypothetical protein